MAWAIRWVARRGRRELELLGGQLLLASPVLFVLGAAAVLRAARGAERVQRVLAAVASPRHCSSRTARCVVGWRPTGPRWPGCRSPRSWGRAGSPARSQLWRRIGLAMGFIGTAALYLQSVTPVVPLAARRDPTSRAYGWADLATAVDSTLGIAAAPAMGGGRTATRMPPSSRSCCRRIPPVFSLNLGGRDNQYRYWPAFRDSAQVGRRPAPGPRRPLRR